MIINNSKTEETVIDFEKEAKVYLLSADEIRSKDIKLNGKVLELGIDDELPEIEASICEEGKVIMPPVSAAFVAV